MTMIFEKKGPLLRVNCQKGSPLSEIAKKYHLRRGGKLHQTACVTYRHSL
jgi:hypothetical protein